MGGQRDPHGRGGCADGVHHGRAVRHGATGRARAADPPAGLRRGFLRGLALHLRSGAAGPAEARGGDAAGGAARVGIRAGEPGGGDRPHHPEVPQPAGQGHARAAALRGAPDRPADQRGPARARARESAAVAPHRRDFRAARPGAESGSPRRVLRAGSRAPGERDPALGELGRPRRAGAGAAGVAGQLAPAAPGGAAHARVAGCGAAPARNLRSRPDPDRGRGRLRHRGAARAPAHGGRRGSPRLPGGPAGRRRGAVPPETGGAGESPRARLGGASPPAPRWSAGCPKS